jgi:hypothetical protein
MTAFGGAIMRRLIKLVGQHYLPDDVAANA